MKRTYLSLLAMVSVLALAGCAKNKTDETQNPDAVSDGSEDGNGGTDGSEAKTPSRARGTTAPRGAGRNTKARKVTAQKPPRKPVEPGGDEGPNGLLVEAYTFEGAEAVPDFSKFGEPARTTTVPNLDFDEVDVHEGFPGLDVTTDYALRFSGSINIIEEAEYELCLHSDDGSQLLLEGTLVVDNDGVHESPVEACELVFLAPGEYRLEVLYFQAQGPLMAMHFAWAINGGDKVIVPTEVLFKP